MSPAGGAVYIQTIIAQELANFQAGREGAVVTPVNVVIRAKFNPNLYANWFSSVMQVVNNITMLAVILTGAALIPEREQGTVEHLLVMPVVPAERCFPNRRLAHPLSRRRHAIHPNSRRARYLTRNDRDHHGSVRAPRGPRPARHATSFRRRDSHGKHARLVATPDADHQSDAAFCSLLAGRPLSWG